ncbi:hypothetical protein [Nocardia wallacei]|uniref:hypothetical protein n=1 Tax=Nocardia wallacei TaxID=480035 RepID=UPI002454E903|nr:hypothetical protein [Nocardia wallacei]
MDDRTYALVKEAAGGNFSEWMTKAARKRLLAEEARAVSLAQRQHPEQTAAEYDEYEAERAAVEESERRRRGNVA